MNPALPPIPSDIMVNPYHSTVWGPQLWRFLHTVAGQYPDNPTSQEKASCRQLLYSLRHLLPCPKCRVHFTKAITQRAPDVSSGAALQRWLVAFHNEVNRRLGKPHDWTYEQVRALYPPPSELETVSGGDYAGQPNDDDELPLPPSSPPPPLPLLPLLETKNTPPPPSPPPINLPSPLLNQQSPLSPPTAPSRRMPFRKQRMPSPRLQRRANIAIPSPRRGRLPTPRASRARSLSPRLIQQRVQKKSVQNATRKRPISAAPAHSQFTTLFEKSKLGLLPRTKLPTVPLPPLQPQPQPPPQPQKPCKSCGKH